MVVFLLLLFSRRFIFAVTLKGANGALGRSGSQDFVIDSSLREESQD